MIVQEPGLFVERVRSMFLHLENSSILWLELSLIPMLLSCTLEGTIDDIIHR